MSVLFIDGENFRHKINAVFENSGKNKPILHEYDFRGLLDKVLADIIIEKRIFYFARIKEYKGRIKKSKQLIEAQRLLKSHLEQQGFEVVLNGRVRGYMEKVNGGKKVLVFKEKGVDVRIAVDMVSLAYNNKSSKIILGSSDSDLQPAIKKIKERGVNCIYLGFEESPNKGLSYTTDRTILIRNSEIFEFEKMTNSSHFT